MRKLLLAGACALSLAACHPVTVASVVSSAGAAVATVNADLQAAQPIVQNLCASVSVMHGGFVEVAPGLGADAKAQQVEAQSFAVLDTICGAMPTNVAAVPLTLLAAYQAYLQAHSAALATPAVKSI